MPVQITYFVHSTTTDNELDLATGWLPGELSQRGKEQAKQLEDQLAACTLTLSSVRTCNAQLMRLS